MEKHAKPIESVLLAYDPEDHRPKAALDMLQHALGEYSVAQAEQLEDADAVVVLGGDGSFIHAARNNGFSEVPLVGISTGTLGYYMGTAPKDEHIDYLVRNLAEGDYRVVDLPVLELRDDQGGLLTDAVNDVVFRAGELQAFKASLEISGVLFEHFSGGGLCFTTPQGSSGEGVAYDGPFIKEGVPAWGVVPEGSHPSKEQLSLVAPMILDMTDEVVVNVKEVHRRPFMVGADGKVIPNLRPGQTEFTVAPAVDKTIRRIRLNDNSYLQDVARIFRGQRQYL